MFLKQFKRKPETDIVILLFDDGFEFELTLKELRENCPCASCKGEEVLLHKYHPVSIKPISQKGYELEKAELVGNYAIKLIWKDGHSNGIYSWEYLRKLSSIEK